MVKNVLIAVDKGEAQQRIVDFVQESTKFVHRFDLLQEIIQCWGLWGLSRIFQETPQIRI